MAKRDRHHDMTDPRALHVVGGSKSNAKISNFFLLYAAAQLANGGTSARGSARNAAERRHVGLLRMEIAFGRKKGEYYGLVAPLNR